MPWCGTLRSTNTSLFVAYLVIVSVLMLTPGPDTLFAWRRA
jgi:threonine/homoserine/homoserine lactone efflux protein